MRVFNDPKLMYEYSRKMKTRGKTIGFVPTMGALHEGHLSLIEAAKKNADIVVASIFVNPTQFGPGDDLARYPRQTRKDKTFLENIGIDALFLPDADKMYVKGFKTSVYIESLSRKLCGKSRPEHFKGVATVVAKLLNIVDPDLAFFGKKDYQQLLIIKALAEELNFPTKIIGLPTVREYDGLAMSSRN
ncbi:MAG: pantoate--beta-alanine ligase, partial [Candidatus Margulisbacteria bacterium]|nr:pantoate--beta-alanine ligase [Candidatus Margulisiibacteriota bacterium]